MITLTGSFDVPETKTYSIKAKRSFLESVLNYMEGKPLTPEQVQEDLDGLNGEIGVLLEEAGY